MTSFSSSRGRLAWGPLAVLTLWAMTRGVFSTRKTTGHSPQFYPKTTEVRRHDASLEVPIVSSGLTASYELWDSRRDLPNPVGKSMRNFHPAIMKRCEIGRMENACGIRFLYKRLLSLVVAYLWA